MRWPTKVLFRSQSPMAGLCGSGQGGWRTRGAGKLKVPRGGVGRGSAIYCSQEAAFYHSPLNGGTPRAAAVALYQKGSSPRTGAHGLHQSGGSQGKERHAQKAGSYFPLRLGLRRGASGGGGSLFLSLQHPALTPVKTQVLEAKPGSLWDLGRGQPPSQSWAQSMHCGRGGIFASLAFHSKSAAHDPGSAGFQLSFLERQILQGNLRRG